MRKLLLAVTLMAAGWAQAADYDFDIKGQHAFIQFKIGHLGFSYIVGQFNEFDGSFTYDEANPAASSVKVTIQTDSVDTNHAERDKHLRSGDFLEVDEYPTATFVSKSVKMTGDGTAEITGDFTFRGVTKELVIDATHVGGGKDPWGNFRQGFEGTTSFALKDFGVPKNLGPASETVEIYMSLEGIRQ